MRPFKTFFEEGQLKAYQSGVLRYEYKGIRCLKSPIDLPIYLKIIYDCQCSSIIEIGSKFGGSALMFRDFAALMTGKRVPVVSIDIKPPEASFEDIEFLEGNVFELDKVFSTHALRDLPRPWLIIEDSAHTADACRAALEFFAEHMRPGEWLVMEDGVLDELGLAEKHGGGPNKAIADFFAVHPTVFEVGTSYCDMFGVNATYSPNGFLNRTNAPFRQQL